MRGIHQVHCLHLGEFNIFVWVFNIILSPLNFIYVLNFKVTIIDVVCTMIDKYYCLTICTTIERVQNLKILLN